MVLCEISLVEIRFNPRRKGFGILGVIIVNDKLEVGKQCGKAASNKANQIF